MITTKEKQKLGSKSTNYHLWSPLEWLGSFNSNDCDGHENVT